MCCRYMCCLKESPWALTSHLSHDGLLIRRVDRGGGFAEASGCSCILCHARDLSAPFESFEGRGDVKARGDTEMSLQFIIL